MNDLLMLMHERKSQRIPFDVSKPIKKADLLKILEAARWAPTAHNMQNFEFIVVDDQRIINEIADLDFPTSFTFVKENYNQLSFSEEELRQKKTGILGTMFPPSWRNPNVKPEDIASEKEHDSLERHNQILPTPLLLLVLYDPKRRAPASEGDFLGIMSLGCMMENIWLMATSLGIDLHVVSSLSGNGIEEAVKIMLKIPQNLTIAISFRLGYPLTPYPYLRVRREIEDFTHHNTYGHRM